MNINCKICQCVIFFGLACLTAVMMGCSDDSRVPAEGQATITVSADGKTSNLSKTSLAGSRAVAGLPSIVNRLDVSVFDGEIVLGSADMFQQDTLSLQVPSGIELTVTGTAFADSDVVFQGQITVAPLRAGVNESVSLSLRPVGPVTARIFDEPVQIDITNAGVAGDQTADVDPGFVFYNENKNILFTANSTNLSQKDTNDVKDIFSRDLISGEITNLHSSDSDVLADVGVSNAVINNDGQYMAFTSDATNLVVGDTNGVTDLFIKNTKTGVVTRILDPDTGEELFEAINSRPHISDDGQRVVMKLTSNPINSGSGEGIYMYDLNSGTYKLIGVGQFPVISGDGNFISHLFDFGEGVDLIGYELAIGEPIGATLFENPLGLKAISRDGRYVAYFSTDGESHEINRYDFTLDSTLTASMDINGIFLDMTSALADTQSSIPAMSANGRYIAFGLGTSIFVKDMLCNGELKEITDAKWPGISPDAELVAYLSTVNNNSLYVAANPALNQPGDCQVSR